LERYPSQNSRDAYGQILRQFFADTAAADPAKVTEEDCFAWVTHSTRTGRPPANNTVRCRISALGRFFRWAVKQDLRDDNPAAALTDEDSPLRSISRTYGKVQAENPGRWLTHEQAYGDLLATCDDTDTGVRDHLVLRLGLLGIRVSEIGGLRLGDFDLAERRIAWTGKRRKPNTRSYGTSMAGVLADYLNRYAAAIHRPLRGTDPLICCNVGHRHAPALQWGRGYKRPKCSLYKIVRRHADAAALGIVSPHDLRRTAVGILHDAKTDDGGHLFDLEDIRKIVDHAYATTTHLCYIAPRQNGEKDRAASVLD
jgi:integrase